MKTSSLVTAATALLLATQTHAMSWIPQPMYDSPAVYPPTFTQDYPSQFSNTYPIVGGDRDAYGCIPSAGYQWCGLKQRCIRPWEESCSESTSYRTPYTQSVSPATVYEPCDRASGSIWCAAKQTCIQPWIEDCAFPATSRHYPTTHNTIRDEHGCIAAQGFYWCEAQSACLRTGTTCTSTYPSGSAVGGSSVQPWDSYGCNALRGEGWCDSKQSCIQLSSESCPYDIFSPRTGCGVSRSYSSVSLPPADRDENGCRRDYGYKWCASLDKCYRPWEERCPEPSANPDFERCTDTARSRTCIGSPGFEWCESKRACVRIGAKCK
ncbi:MAG: hypothetical protein PHZ00_06855 [Candidatus Peribacteraceae bacterium]|nr:hypothetical protein [Candidatus Peribacteraceae bacterium]